MKVILKFLQVLPLAIVNFKLVENIFYVNSGQYFLSYKQICSIIIVLLIDILLFYKNRYLISTFLFLAYLIFCCFDIFRYSVITTISESGFSLNGLGVEITTQPLSLKLLVVFLILNYKNLILPFKPKRTSL